MPPAPPKRKRSGEPELALFDDVQASEHVVGHTYYPHTISVVDPHTPFRGTMRAISFGPIVLGELDYNVGLELTCPHISAYHLNVPVVGAVRSISRGVDVHTVPGRAALYRYESGAVLRTATKSRFHLCALKIDSQALEATLAAMVGRPMEARIDFAPEIDLRAGLGRRWWQLVNSVCSSTFDNPLLANPMVANPLGQSILSGLLAVSENQFAEWLREPPRSPAPPAIRLAEDYMLEHIGEPITVAEVARTVRLSTRSLQRGFVEYLGQSPHDYLQSRRLEGAHADLVAGSPETTRVGEIAMRWGFSHVGRFAQAYRRRYGTTPIHTLRR